MKLVWTSNGLILMCRTLPVEASGRACDDRIGPTSRRIGCRLASSWVEGGDVMLVRKCIAPSPTLASTWCLSGAHGSGGFDLSDERRCYRRRLRIHGTPVQYWNSLSIPTMTATRSLGLLLEPMSSGGFVSKAAVLEVPYDATLRRTRSRQSPQQYQTGGRRVGSSQCLQTMGYGLEVSSWHQRENRFRRDRYLYRIENAHAKPT